MNLLIKEYFKPVSKFILVSIPIIWASWVAWTAIKPIRIAINFFVFIVMCSFALNIVGCGVKYSYDIVKKNPIYVTCQTEIEKNQKSEKEQEFKEEQIRKQKIKDMEKNKAENEQIKITMEKIRIERDLLDREQEKIAIEKEQAELEKNRIEQIKNTEISPSVNTNQLKIFSKNFFKTNNLKNDDLPKVELVAKTINKLSKIYRPTEVECDELIEICENVLASDISDSYNDNRRAIQGAIFILDDYKKIAIAIQKENAMQSEKMVAKYNTKKTVNTNVNTYQAKSKSKDEVDTSYNYKSKCMLAKANSDFSVLNRSRSMLAKANKECVYGFNHR